MDLIRAGGAEHDKREDCGEGWNARVARNIFEQTINQQANRIIAIPKVWDLTKAGKIRATKAGARTVYSIKALMAFLEAGGMK